MSLLLLYNMSLTVSSDTVVSPFNTKPLRSFVAVVGFIFVALNPAPLTATPSGTVSGNSSSYSPAAMLTVSPAVAAARAYLIVRNGVEECLPLAAPPNRLAALVPVLATNR